MSNITTSTININFPVAGKDNDSQGFRDNFSAIARSLNTASVEITSLQTTATYLMSALGIINNATSAVPPNNTIDVTTAAYRLLRPTTSTTYTLSGWVNNTYSKVRLHLRPATADTMQISFVGSGLVNPTLAVGVTLPYTSAATSSTFWDAWSVDGGTTIYLSMVGTSPFQG